ncbi:hypothetical protein [Aurantibacillus circumpalustris]|uniref:hypothetical protein n=1 Tax=Aurantibacillus circumpalustris TaxID=3036359 RepID=UPI00295A867B|nr:hypothetical protein [Aurantibacillus circumpalustris]
MKKFLSVILLGAGLTIAAQPKKAPKMAPILAEGYYVNSKNDTVVGNIQANPESETEFYQKFYFQPAKGGKIMPVDPKKAKAYGFDGRHFVLLASGDGLYIERLASGRLNLFEYKYDGKVDGYDHIVSDYYMQDTRAEGSDIKLKEINKISNKFYKKDLKPYMKDQLMLWTDLDKFTFDKQAVISAINEFNKFYAITAN